MSVPTSTEPLPEGYVLETAWRCHGCECANNGDPDGALCIYCGHLYCESCYETEPEVTPSPPSPPDPFDYRYTGWDRIMYGPREDIIGIKRPRKLLKRKDKEESKVEDGGKVESHQPSDIPNVPALPPSEQSAVPGGMTEEQEENKVEKKQEQQQEKEEEKGHRDDETPEKTSEMGKKNAEGNAAPK